MKKYSVKGTYALVTGGCSGIGLQYVRQFASRGYSVLMVSNEEEKNLQAAASVQKEFPEVKIRTLTTDLSLETAAADLYGYCRQQHLEVDVLVSNAGIFFFEEVKNASPEKMRVLLRLQVETPTQLCHYFAADMCRKRRGNILITDSLAAWFPYPGIAVYAASKRYLHEFARALRYEVKDYGVNVSIVCPGAVDTNLYHLSDGYRKLARRLGVMCSPEHLAKVAVRAMFRGRFQKIPGFGNAFCRWLAPVLPPCVIFWIKRISGLYPMD